MAVAAGAAFTFTYADTLDALAAAGVEAVPVDPAHDAALPDGVAGLIAGGGFPEVHAADLAANAPLLADVRTRVAGGMPTWAECGGLLWLCRTLDGAPLVGAVPADARMTDRLTLGYRTATAATPSPVGPAGHGAAGPRVPLLGRRARGRRAARCRRAGASGATASPRRRCWPPTCTSTRAATRRRWPRSPGPVPRRRGA